MCVCVGVDGVVGWMCGSKLVIIFYSNKLRSTLKMADNIVEINRECCVHRNHHNQLATSSVECLCIYEKTTLPRNISFIHVLYIEYILNIRWLGLGLKLSINFITSNKSNIRCYAYNSLLVCHYWYAFGKIRTTYIFISVWNDLNFSFEDALFRCLYVFLSLSQFYFQSLFLYPFRFIVL